MTMLDHYKNISPTAKLVAQMRSYSDIPFASEIARSIGADEMVNEMLGGQPFELEVLRWMAPLSEARYKSLWRGIQQEGTKQIIELASGFSFRGAAMSEDPSVRYLETDLPDVHMERVELRRLLEASGTLPPRPGLIFEPANLMSESDMTRVTALLNPGQPLAVVHEGLFQYFSMEEKREGARIIGSLLKRFGGVWMTPDFETKDDTLLRQWTHPQFMTLARFLADTTQRNLSASAFESAEHVSSFFEELGFRVSVRPQIDDNLSLFSAQKLGVAPEQLRALRESRRLWSLRLI